jgi:hypothetical protein
MSLMIRLLGRAPAPGLLYDGDASVVALILDFPTDSQVFVLTGSLFD